MTILNITSLGIMFTVYTENSIRPLHEVLQQQSHASVCSFSKVICVSVYCLFEHTTDKITYLEVY